MRVKLGLLATVLVSIGAVGLTPTTAWANPNTQSESLRVLHSSHYDGYSITMMLDFPAVDEAARKAVLDATQGLVNGGTAAVSPMSYDGIVRCNNPRGWLDQNGYFTYQHRCGGTVANWGFKISSSLQAIITSLVSEQGMGWYRNGLSMPRQAPHIESKDYQFHGTFNPTLDGDVITYGDYYWFRVNVGGQTGTGELYIWGTITNVT